MTKEEAIELITKQLEKNNCYDINFKSLVLSENTIRAAVTYKQHGGEFIERYKELLILRTAGKWRILM